MDNEVFSDQFVFIDCEDSFVGLTPAKDLQLGDCGPTSHNCEPKTYALLGDCQEPSI